jgi:hypothetical protein
MFSFSLYTETERTGIAPGRQGDGISNELICLAPKFYAKISTQLTRERERERERERPRKQPHEKHPSVDVQNRPR